MTNNNHGRFPQIMKRSITSSRGRHVLFWTLATAIPLYVMIIWTSASKHILRDEDRLQTRHQKRLLDGELPFVTKNDFTMQRRNNRNGTTGDTAYSSTVEMIGDSNAFKRDHLATTTNQLETPFIHYELYQDRPYNITFGPYTKCQLGITYNKRGKKPIERVPLKARLQEVMNMTTFLKTNLKILSLGDSVGIQFHQILEEAVGGVWNDTRRTVYHNAWGDHESVSVLAWDTTVVAAFRMTGLLLHSGKDNPPPNAGPNLKTGAGGWIPEQVQELLQHEYTTTLENGVASTVKIHNFDILLFRIPHGWLTLDTITKENLHEALVLAHDLFGVHTVVMHSLFFNNNVRTLEEFQQLHQTNTMIRQFVNNWNHPTIKVFLLDFGRWIDQLVEWNAQNALFMDISSANKNYTLQRLGCVKYPPSLAMACATLENRTECTCIRNRLSIDGMHWCMESMGGRILGGTACLIQCSLMPQAEHRSCEKRCNDDFMSLEPARTVIESYSKNHP